MANLVKKIRTNSGDLQIDYNALANLPTISNPNLLINSDFRCPVNQRGQMSYSNSNDWEYCYGIDRWASIGGLNTNTVTINSNKSITIKNNSSDSMNFRQWFDTDHNQRYMDGTYTVTISVLSLSGTVCVKLNDSTQSNALVNGKNIITLNCTPLFLSFEIGGNASIELEYVKLEYGALSTAFVPRTYSEELTICQRYAYVFAPCNHYTLSYHTFASAENKLNFSVKFPTTMHKTPSLTALNGKVNCVYNDNYNLVYESTSIGLDTANQQTAKVQVQYASNFTTNVPAEFFAYADLKLLFEAEV